MSNSEASFRDRQGKAQLLHDFIEGFTPTFAPPDGTLSPANFQITINGVDAANSSVETLTGNYTTAATQRVVLVKLIASRVTQSLSYVKSNTAWEAQFKTAKMAADKYRGGGRSKPAAPAPAPEGEPAPTEGEKKRNQGQRGYTELVAHYQAFINAVTSCVGYAPPSADISLMKLNEHLSAFKGLNQFITELDGQLTTARSQRAALYNGEDGLKEKFQAVKNGIMGQYGQNSAEYASVKSIKW